MNDGNSDGNWNCEAKLMETEMVIKRLGMERNGIFVCKEIPSLSDSYQIYSNVQIEFTVMEQSGLYNPNPVCCFCTAVRDK